MKDILIILVIVAILALASWYVIRSKKKGKSCIGCPDGGCAQCGGHCHDSKMK